MTTGPSFEFKRTSDTSGWFGRSRAWWRLNGGLVLGPLFVLLAVWLFYVSVQVYANDSAQDRAAREACERSQEFGPYIASDFERRNVFPAGIEPRYRALIPQDCPR